MEKKLRQSQFKSMAIKLYLPHFLHPEIKFKLIPEYSFLLFNKKKFWSVQLKIAKRSTFKKKIRLSVKIIINGDISNNKKDLMTLLYYLLTLAKCTKSKFMNDGFLLLFNFFGERKKNARNWWNKEGLEIYFKL